MRLGPTALALMVALGALAAPSAAAKPRSQQQQQPAHEKRRHQEAADPMEPCYLANNRASESLTISESTPVGTVVGEIMVNGDSSAVGNIELSIRMPAAAAAAPRQGARRDLTSLMELLPPLSIEPNTKRLILAKKLDRESLDRYLAAGGYAASASPAAHSAPPTSSAALTVHIKCQLRANASARARPDTSILIPVHLIVTDDNDNWPVFLNGPYVLELNESAPAGQPLAAADILAVDQDQQGPLSTIEYSLLAGSPWSDSFAFLNPLDARSLVVRDPRLLDYEAQPRIGLRLLARDQGEPPNWAVAPLYINLLDQDDQGPRFAEDQYLGRLRHNRPGEPVELLPRRLAARDADRAIQAPLVYSFHAKTNHSAHFELDPDLGRLTLRKSLPEPGLGFCLLLRASQLDKPARFTLAALLVGPAEPDEEAAVGQLLLNGKQEPRRPQQALQFARANYTLQVSEAAPPGAALLQLKLAAPPADLQLDQLEYQLLDDDMGQFQLDQRTGRLSLNKSLDYELYRLVSVRVLATGTQRDPSRAPRLACDTTRVNVQVINHNEHAPEFSHEQYNFQLSVSDLVASFDQNQLPQAATAATPSSAPEKLQRRALVGDTASFALADDTRADQDEPQFRWMKLGQIYCADRDLGDRVSLQLKGPKAQLFHLSQSGHLYLPLANHSQAQQFQPVKRLLSEQLHLDRQYLNHLLGELSNLGRLRLKVLAVDDGQPEARQSSALIVVTIVTIDSFISFHQHHQHHQPLVDAQTAPIQLTNETSYDTSSESRSLAHSPASQLMVIPATNGRSYVQINPDIIGNLVQASANDSSADQMLASDSSPNKTTVAASARQEQSPQPPSLLLVDDEGGAKFVAMPQAIEVYQQQVQEQQARVRHQQQRSAANSLQASSQDSWWPGAWWRAQPRDSGLIHWLNASTALLLHLITLAAVVALLSRLRNSGSLSNWWPPGGGGDNAARLAHQSSTNGSSSGLFTSAHHQPSFFSSWSLNSTGNARAGAKVSGEPSAVASGRGEAADLVGDNGFGFLQPSSSYLTAAGDSPELSTAAQTRCGPVVSAMSAGSGTTLNKTSQPDDDNVGADKPPYGQAKATPNKQRGELEDAPAPANTFDGLRVGLMKKEMESEVGESWDQKTDSRSSTFVGSSKQSEQGQATVVSISVSAPKVAGGGCETAKEEAQRKSTKLASSPSSSVVSLVSLSSSSISNKIAASVERAGCGHATGSDVSSLDSNSLFTSTNSSGAAAGSAPLPPPPPPPPPPPCMVQAGASSCLDSTKPFSSPPVILTTVKPSDLRRPQPQNPAHVKLRQQATTMGAKSSQVLQFGAPKHKGVQTTTAPPPPPLPPPLPSSLNGLSSLKTVSPTTSVDRGYESLQSYTSSSHNHHHHHHHHHHQDLTKLSSQKTPNKQTNLRPSQLVSGNKSQQLSAVGRQAQRQQASHRVSQAADGLLTKSTNQNSFSSTSRPTRRGSIHLQQCQRKLPGRQQHQFESGGCQQLDYGVDETTTTEDDDEFYCCYDQGAPPSGTGAGGGGGKAVEGLLSEYASHAYKPAARDWQPQGCQHHQHSYQQHRGRILSTAATTTRGNDLMMIKYHHQQPPEDELYHRQRRYQHQFGHQQPLNKKQLTWSDQVDHLA